MKKIVITGAPGSGKSELIKKICESGYYVEKEVARILLDEMRKQGFKDPHKEDRAYFQKKVLENQLNCEANLPKEELVFLDRGIIDALAFYQLGRINPPKKLRSLVYTNRYDMIFYLDMIPQNQLQMRNLEENERIEIDRLLKIEYKKAGYKIIRIPILPVSKRLNIIFKRLKVR